MTINSVDGKADGGKPAAGGTGAEPGGQEPECAEAEAAGMRAEFAGRKPEAGGSEAAGTEPGYAEAEAAGARAEIAGRKPGADGPEAAGAEPEYAVAEAAGLREKFAGRKPGADGPEAAGAETEYAGSEFLRENERFDDLQRNGYRIIQNRAGFRFGMDAVLLSGFARVLPGEQVLDLGTGSGIIPILLEAKTPGRHFTGLEIQADMADMAARSVAYNGLQEKIHIVQGDIKEAGRLFGGASFDVVTSNPPYMDGGKGLTNPDVARAIARHEILCTFEDVARETAKVLKTGGRFYLVHRPRRLPELIGTLRQYRLEPKRMKFVHPFADKEANMVLIEAVRGGRPLMKIEAPVIIFREPGVYSDEIRETYGY